MIQLIYIHQAYYVQVCFRPQLILRFTLKNIQKIYRFFGKNDAIKFNENILSFKYLIFQWVTLVSSIHCMILVTLESLREFFGIGNDEVYKMVWLYFVSLHLRSAHGLQKKTFFSVKFHQYNTVYKYWKTIFFEKLPRQTRGRKLENPLLLRNSGILLGKNPYLAKPRRRHAVQEGMRWISASTHESEIYSKTIN